MILRHRCTTGRCHNFADVRIVSADERGRACAVNHLCTACTQAALSVVAHPERLTLFPVEVTT